eukprot:11183693-Lingulodinium_polyedra.AAC.1
MQDCGRACQPAVASLLHHGNAPLAVLQGVGMRSQDSLTIAMLWRLLGDAKVLLAAKVHVDGQWAAVRRCAFRTRRQ